MADAPASPETVELLVGAALAVGTLPAAHAVAASFGALGAPEQEALQRHPLLATPLEKLLALSAGGVAVSSWSEWLARLAREEPFKEALAIAELGAVEWPADEPADEAGALAIARALTTLPAHVRPTLERALPELLAYLDRRPAPDELGLVVLAAVLEVLAYGDSRTRAVREAMLSVLDRLLEATPGAEGYEEMLECVEVVWQDVRAARTLSWLADVFALLLVHASPAPERRVSLVRRGLVDASTFREVDRTDLEFLRAVAADPALDGALTAELDALPDETPTADAGPLPRVLDPVRLTVGIYTLSPAAARQAKAVLSKRYPSLDIELNHEKVDSDLLRGFARRADVVAVVIASAKHAATGAIRHHCRPGALLEVGTAGSTGLVRAIIGRVEELAAV
jgi:hypothetical protein